MRAIIMLLLYATFVIAIWPLPPVYFIAALSSYCLLIVCFNMFTEKEY